MLMMRTAVRFFGLVLLWHATTAQEGGGCSEGTAPDPASLCQEQVLRGQLGSSQRFEISDWCPTWSGDGALEFGFGGNGVNVGAQLSGTSFTIEYWRLGRFVGTYGFRHQSDQRDLGASVTIEVFSKLSLESEGGTVKVTHGENSLECARENCAVEIMDSEVTLEVIDTPGRVFTGWYSPNGDQNGCRGVAKSLILQSNVNIDCKATFMVEEDVPVFVDISYAPGSVRSITVTGMLPQGDPNPCANSMGGCSWSFEKNSSGTITVTPADNFEFQGWASTCESEVLPGGQNLSFPLEDLTEDVQLCAKMRPVGQTEHTLTVEVQGVGSVQISSSGQPIATCTSGACAEVLPHNASIRLTPSANVTWSGANATICELRDGFRLTEDIHCIAVFEAGADCSSPVEAPELEAWQAGSLIAPSGGLYEVTSGMPVEVRVVNAVPAQQPIYHWRSERDSNWRAITNQAVVVSDSFTCSGLPEVIEVRLTACNKTEITSITFNCQ